ncbi:MAG: hypothetical protein Q6364_13910 [Candidatus Hermodarchaeota archaeon]|nr:hypothetical protein [Candidatus Hermodarchaeota archaeon]
MTETQPKVFLSNRIFRSLILVAMILLFGGIILAILLGTLWVIAVGLLFAPLILLAVYIDRSKYQALWWIYTFICLFAFIIVATYFGQAWTYPGLYPIVVLPFSLIVLSSWFVIGLTGEKYIKPRRGH